MKKIIGDMEVMTEKIDTGDTRPGEISLGQVVQFTVKIHQSEKITMIKNQKRAMRNTANQTNIEKPLPEKSTKKRMIAGISTREETKAEISMRRREEVETRIMTAETNT